jgi:hypothetical protein
VIADARRFIALDPPRKTLVLQALMLLIVTRAALRMMSLPTLRQALTLRKSRHDIPANLVVWAVSVVARRLPGTTCLSEAVTAEMLLRRHGRAPILRIGVKSGHLRVPDAHAWVECDGLVVMGAVDDLSGYAVLS